MRTPFFNVMKLMIILTAGILSACKDEPASADKKRLVVAFGPSTYVDQFEQGIKPLLEAKGYTVEAKIFSQNQQINPAMKEGAIDASVFQSSAYMQEMNARLNMTMIKLADTASAPQTLRSLKHQSVDDIRDGMVVVIPQDPVNAERAARILQALGWVKIRPEVAISGFSLKDIEADKVTLDIRGIDSAQVMRALQDVDYAVVNGNYVVSANLKISDGLVVEQTPDEHVVVVNIRAHDLEAPWAKALKAAYESQEFADYIKSEPLYKGFIFPKVWSIHTQ